ncbi:hypothetical protein B0I72DRAFT_138536 [Yarrowia lipolytica]|jgi:glutamine synthetase|uniref:Glutamine synthetase n=2 Tax=Yarrowia lipolytica TaxID=4952 RepID=Q6C990_YARLI|nr:YALI0D13024p [Yarrowia lipolytica CLIB122]AOW03998.1 hypothetical protein YALI1_D16151g [Yarrowia lipolytica]KAB8285176.1 hypothetical protein BKA91DRAFT_133941 [Yarrowia lipolytica]KAE8171222.1 hypothetical protein BKA90DRAFT_139381 [Yarrowia lipolytica]KAJ8054440.1 hypothetical protein LXG23DRAFT_19857 [Yarrowia lipolytica]QNP97823.1 Type-1 glutamine synthetase 2 [Yarrowia lipolytica]|eukprot:XP_502772.1 YALI0D13024p [Yarrowia lipolytica CLIB122]
MNWESELENDTAVKVAGIDIDGIVRGKSISKAKFLSVISKGFGFCGVIFGWDMHDKNYTKELTVSNKDNGYRDLLAIIDLSSFRRLPWENNIPFFLVHFKDSVTQEEIAPCPRSLLTAVTGLYFKDKMKAMAGAELEFYNFCLDRKDLPDSFAKLPPISTGMFGYSVQRPALNGDYFQAVWDTALKIDAPLEGWHTETGPGVLEAAIAFDEVNKLADKTSLFKLMVKSIAPQYKVIPCFMAKPQQGMPGNSGHLHVSLVDQESGKNLFARDQPDPNPEWPDVEYLSDLGRHFLAGVLDGLPDIMPMFAPTINSYKRLVENFWAPVTVSWGLEHRIASIRLIAPPTGSASATRFEIRTPGADVQPHFALAAILALGHRGIAKKMPLTVPPMGDSSPDKFERLPRDLMRATEHFMRPDSLARELFGDKFVEHYGETRLHECREFMESVTAWEVDRYIETV